jgi:ribose transport system permease protein
MSNPTRSPSTSPPAAEATIAPDAPRGRRVTIEHVRDYGIIVVFIVLFVVLSITSPSFLSVDNLLNIVRQNTAVGIIACAATLVIIGGGFDLSVGAVYFLAGVASAWIAVHVNVPLALLGGIVVGFLLGGFNGLLSTRLNISSFLATLATSLVFAGAGAAITKGFPITVSDPAFAKLGTEGIGRLTYSVMVFAVVAIVLQLLLTRTTFGRYVFAVGGNSEAARNSGVRVDRIRVTTFIVSGMAAGLAGVIDASTVSSGGTDSGASLILSSIAAVALGGTSIFGGVGAVWKTILGVMLLAMIANGFDLLSIASYYQDMFEGFVIIVAVAINSLAIKQ